MKSITVILVSLFFLNNLNNLSAQLTLYGRYTVSGTVEPDINIFGTKKISDKLNLTYFALIEEKWSEALVGFSYAPKDWCSVGVSAGVEHNPAVLRFGGSIWLGKGNTSLLLLGEKGDGRDNYWYKADFSQKLSETLTFGAMAWRFHGIGPIVKYTPKKSDFTFWLVPARDFEFKATRFILGVSLKM